MADILVSHFWVGDHHPRWWIAWTNDRPSQHHVQLNPACARASDSIPRGTEPRVPTTELTHPDRTVDLVHASILHESAIFHGRSVILLYDFATMNSTILLHWTHPFCYTELSHFTSLNSAIFATLLSYFMILLQWTQSFCDLVSHFPTLNSSILLQC
jgi:hypothetical protein